MPSDVTRQNMLASGSIDFSGKCWNNIMFETDAALGNDWPATTMTSHTLTANSGVGIVHYREIFNWITIYI
jgi:hypothetical protein